MEELYSVEINSLPYARISIVPTENRYIPIIGYKNEEGKIIDSITGIEIVENKNNDILPYISYSKITKLNKKSQEFWNRNLSTLSNEVKIDYTNYLVELTKFIAIEYCKNLSNVEKTNLDGDVLNLNMRRGNF